ncbi:ATP-binding cassette domain-containing protein [Trichothermofontia sichuanensis]
MNLPISPSPIIQVMGLRKQYGSHVAVRSLTFEVEPGEIFGLIGPDGAGKTTTFHILAGILEATAGEVRVLDRPPRDARLQIGYLTQQFSLYLDLSIDENLRYNASLRQVRPLDFQQRRDQYLRLMGLDRFPDRLAGQLSGGMKQKLALCCALISQPPILLLDEPTTGVDPVSRREFWDVLATLAEAGMTIVVATPYLDEAERCNRIGLIYDGELQAMGTLPQLRANLGLSRLEVRLRHVQDLARAEQCLQAGGYLSGANSPIMDVQTFGDRLDILVPDPEVGAIAVRSRLQDSQIPLTSLQPTEVTLENVFVVGLRQEGADPPFIPFPRQSPASPRQEPVHAMSAPASSASDRPLAIEARGLQKHFGSFRAVKDVTLAIDYGEIYGLLGANGAGKTTTIKMLCGLLEPSGGHIALAGETDNLRSQTLRQRLGYMSQKFTLYDDLTVVENLAFYCGVYGVPVQQRRSRIEWVLATCGLVGKETLITGQLPGGWKQRVAFGASVMHEPEILFLDEPTSGVDPLARRQFWRLIEDLARRGTAVLVTTHYLEEAEHCHRMGFMVNGEVVAQGTPSEIKAAQPGQLLELVCDRPQRGAQLLKQQLAPWQVSIFGDRLHLVLAEVDRELPQVQSMLARNEIHIHSLRPIPFSLEDAFIGIVQRTQSR